MKSHRSYLSITSLFWIFCYQPCLAESEPKISVYTTDSYHIVHPELATQIYYLDNVVNFENYISQRLNQDPQIAEQQAQRLFHSSEWQMLEAQLKNAYSGVISGWQNGIKKVPAILFESSTTPTAVIYGEPNVSKAIQRWQIWTENRGEK